jgi:hypothetical protein
MESTNDLTGLIQFLAEISLAIVALSAVAAIYYLAAFGIGLSKLGGTASMHEKAPEPKLVLAYLVGSILFGSFTYMLGVSYMTFYNNSGLALCANCTSSICFY